MAANVSASISSEDAGAGDSRVWAAAGSFPSSNATRDAARPLQRQRVEHVGGRRTGGGWEFMFYGA